MFDYLIGISKFMKCLDGPKVKKKKKVDIDDGFIFRKFED